ncbi:MAG TPA: pitrilysin family protein [Mycobacteriales bacterium]|nr:pitrilysin family protein [Mycobacteriales bacterium]
MTESVPGSRSAAYGIWTDTGSRDESRALAGASHYLEHLLFKGTPTRDALEIAAVFDRVGGDANAFTTKEHTCYYAHVLAEDFALAVDVVTDMVCSSLLRNDDVEAERGVILEEIAMHEDDAADAVHDAFSHAVFGDTPLGRPIIGTEESIGALSRTAINRYYRSRYAAPTMVVAAAGAIEHRDVVKRAGAAFRRGGLLDDTDAAPAPLRSTVAPRAKGDGLTIWDRPTEQANIVIGTHGFARRDERRFALGVLNNALGGGMSSRLFQEVREKRGLAYSVYSFASAYADAGLFGVYAGCAPKRVKEVLAVTRDVLADVAAHGLTDDEMLRGKGQLRGALVLGLEDTSARMTRIGKAALAYGEQMSVDETLRRIEAVTPDEVRALAAELLTPGSWCGAVVGKMKDDSVMRKALAA